MDIKNIFLQFINLITGMPTWEVKVKTMAYNSSGGARDYVPAGVIFSGWVNGDKLISSEDVYFSGKLVLKKGWYINKLDAREISVEPPPPEPPPPPPPSEIAYPDYITAYYGNSQASYWPGQDPTGNGFKLYYGSNAKYYSEKGKFWVLPDTLVSDPEYIEYDNGVRVAREAAQRLGGCPCVFIVGEIDNHKNSHATPMTEPWQWFAFDLLYMGLTGFYAGNIEDILAYKQNAFPSASLYFDKVVQVFTSFYGNSLAFANKKGFPYFTNYITGEICDEDMALDKVRVCGTDSLSADITYSPSGQIMAKVPVFYQADNPPLVYDISILQDTRVGRATNIYAGGAVTDFPSRAGFEPGLPYYYPRVARRDVFYPASYLAHYVGARRPVGFIPMNVQ